MSVTSRLPQVRFEKETHSYYVGNVQWPSVTQILGAFDHGLDMIDADVLSRKAAFGSAVHKACELNDAGTLDMRTVHPTVFAYLRQWRRFLDEMQVEVLDNEHIVINRAHYYVGTNDRLLKFGRFKRAVCDIKSGVKRPWHEWQTGGYKAAANRFDAPVDGRCCLYLTPDTYKLIVHEDESDPAVFLNMATVYHSMKRKGVLK